MSNIEQNAAKDALAAKGFVRTWASAHPWTAVVVAFAVGAVLGTFVLSHLV